jgi:hypothetical protein
MSDITTQKPVTFDDIMHFFAESRLAFQEEMRQWRLETEQRDAQRAAETKAADEKRAVEEAKRAAETKAADEKRAIEEAKRAAEAAKRAAEAEKEMKALRTELGKLGNRLGDFVQEMVRPAAVRLFQERGLPVHRILPNMQYRNDAGQSELEVDLFVINGTVGILIECKIHASIDDVNEHLKRLDKFRRYFGEFKDIKLHAAIAAMVMPDEVARYAYKKGMFVMAQNGDSIDIKNDGKFTPKEW